MVKKELNYTYDDNGNIINDGVYTYEYDDLNRLYQTVEIATGIYTSYYYNNSGNLVNVLTQGNGNSDSVSRTYSGNKMVKYNQIPITYDDLGNPLSYYNGTQFTWQMGRQLASATLSDNTQISYKYNADGIRTSKTVGNVTTSYTLIGSKITGQSDEIPGIDSTINNFYFRYDGSDNLVGFDLNGSQYFYLTNLLGDVIAIIDSNGDCVVEYKYNPWGVCTIICDEPNRNLATLNPFRYRGYYYDNDTGLYYLQSRYYDPVTCKFINIDEPAILFETAASLQGTFLWDYCENNPVAYVDFDGYKATPINVQVKNNIKIYVSKDTIYQKGVWGKEFIKSKIDALAEKYLTDRNYLLSAAMFHHALYGKGKSIDGETLRLLKTRIRKSKTINELLKNQIKKAQSKNLNVCSIERREDNPIEFTKSKDPDLYYSLQHACCRISCKKTSTNKWDISIYLWDKYDFTEFSRTLNYGVSVGNVANDFGFVLQKLNLLKPYDVKVNHKFTITI